MLLCLLCGVSPFGNSQRNSLCPFGVGGINLYFPLPYLLEFLGRFVDPRVHFAHVLRGCDPFLWIFDIHTLDEAFTLFSPLCGPAHGAFRFS